MTGLRLGTRSCVAHRTPCRKIIAFQGTVRPGAPPPSPLQSQQRERCRRRRRPEGEMPKKSVRKRYVRVGWALLSTSALSVYAAVKQQEFPAPAGAAERDSSAAHEPAPSVLPSERRRHTWSRAAAAARSSPARRAPPSRRRQSRPRRRGPSDTQRARWRERRRHAAREESMQVDADRRRDRRRT